MPHRATAFWELKGLRSSCLVETEGLKQLQLQMPTWPLTLEVFEGGKWRNCILKDLLWKIPNPESSKLVCLQL